MTAPKDFHIWEGVYPTLGDAARDAVGPGFSGETYQRRSLDVTRESIAALKRGAPIPAFHKQRSTLLPVAAAMLLRPDRALRIVDFGGGLGIGYLTLAEALGSDAAVDYTIVEVPAVCATGRSLYPGGEVTYTDTLPAGPFDLVHSASALQYVEDWRGLLAGLCGYGASHILLSDVFAGPVATYATLQTYYESRIPHWMLDLDEVLRVLADGGYRLAMKSYVSSRRLDAEDVLPMDNLPAERRIGQTLHLLLQRVP